MWYGRDKYKEIFKGATGGRVAAPAFAQFYKKLLELKPNLKRKFDMPKGVYVGKVDGKTEFYTATSPLPKNNPNDDMYENASNLPNVDKKSKPKKETKAKNDKDENGTSIGNDIIEIYDNSDNSSENIDNSGDSEDVEVLF